MKRLMYTKGFTLVEVMIALIIITIGIVGYSMLQGNNTLGNSKSESISQMTMLADAEIEKIVNMNYDDCISSHGIVILRGKNYVRNCTVNENASGHYKNIILTLSSDVMDATFYYVKTKNYE